MLRISQMTTKFFAGLAILLAISSESLGEVKNLRSSTEGSLIANSIEKYLRDIFPETSDAIPYSYYSPYYAKRTRADISQFTYDTQAKTLQLDLVIRYSIRDKFTAKQAGSVTGKIATSGSIANNTFNVVIDLGRAKGLINIGAATSWIKERLSKADVDTLPPIPTEVFVPEAPVTQYQPVLNYEILGDRVGIITANNILYVKQGGLNATFTEVYNGAADFQLSGNRIALLTNQDKLYVKEGGLTSNFTLIAAPVKRFQLEGDRIAILDDNGKLSVKEGGLGASWVEQYNGAIAFHMNGSRIGVVTSGGVLYVKSGGLSDSFIKQHSNVASFQLNGTKIGVITKDNRLRVHEGALQSNQDAYTELYQPVRHAQIQGQRIGMITGTGVLFVKEGGLGGTFVQQYNGTNSFQLLDDRIGMVTNTGDLYTKKGGLNAEFTQVTADKIDTFQMTNNRIAILTKPLALKVQGQ